MSIGNEFAIPFQQTNKNSVKHVGGKNASLGEMLNNLGKKGIRIPNGFATTAKAYHHYLAYNKIDFPLNDALSAYHAGKLTLQQAGKKIRTLFRHGKFSNQLRDSIADGYETLCNYYQSHQLAVAVRSSATAEDLPEASFAGQQESYLNVIGLEEVLNACKSCYASLFTDRAIYYREKLGYDHQSVALSIGVQKMVESSDASAGVMFSIESDSGCPNIILINGSWGLGESVVSGQVDPDEFMLSKAQISNHTLRPIIKRKCGEKLHKTINGHDHGIHNTKLVPTSFTERSSFCLTDDELLTLGRWAVEIESHYGRAMDIEWAKDSKDQNLYCVQARPETVHSNESIKSFKQYKISPTAPPIVEGIAIGQSVASGRVCVLKSPKDMGKFQAGDILVTTRTDPDWGPIMKKSAAIITDHGGRTSHAAIVSRELGIPAIVGAAKATSELKNEQTITVSCAEGQKGYVYDGKVPFHVQEISLANLPKSPVDIMINLATPDSALRWWKLPTRGIGLARIEFIISNQIKIHPLALANYESLSDQKVIDEIDKITFRYSDKKRFFIENLAEGIALLAASQYPNPTIVRLSDFKTNEYAQLIGGQLFEKHEENPMLGFRGASRYYSDTYKLAFQLECEAIKFARNIIGLENIKIMIPFCRSIEEAEKVLQELKLNDLVRHKNSLEIYMMSEIPANAFLAKEFAKKFDGFSIGSNDLTQLILGVDRDEASLAHLFNERDPAVKFAIKSIIEGAHQEGIKVGICGQAPSDYPDFAKFLVQSNIDSISLNPDKVIDTILELSKMPDETTPYHQTWVS